MRGWGKRKKHQQENDSPAPDEEAQAPEENAAPPEQAEAQAEPQGEAAPVEAAPAEATAETPADAPAGENVPENPDGSEQEAAPEGDSGDDGDDEDDDDDIDPESVRQMREIDQETFIARKFGWHRLGKKFLEVTKPLSDDIKLQISKAQSEAMMEIERIELQKKAAMSDFKSRIETLQSAAIEAAKKILHGEHTENGHFPVFFDPRTNERVYYDPKVCEEVKRVPAKPEDYQMRFPATETEGAPASGAPELPAAEASNQGEEPNTVGDAAPSDASNEVEEQAAPTEDPGTQPAPESQPEPAEGDVRKDEWRQDESRGVSGVDGPQEEESRAP